MGAGKSTIDPDLLAAETLSKRVVLYKLAMQEGSLAPFTATVKDAANANFPAVTKQFLTSWWKMDWATTTLKPLPPNEITLLESAVFPTITIRVEQYDKPNGWVLLTLGYDPDQIRPYIAEAHKNWPQQQRDDYLIGQESDCSQVWCGKVNGEWKILAHITCMENMNRAMVARKPRMSAVLGYCCAWTRMRSGTKNRC